jgi:RNA polymerase sigma-70 factor (ECF subfamily)
MMSTLHGAGVETSLDAGGMGACATGEKVSMTEAEFRELYAETARPLKSYLSRLLSSVTLADDFLQECYYRILRAELPEMDMAGRKNYLYRIATNLARDHFRRGKFEPAPLDERTAEMPAQKGGEYAGDVEKVMAEIPSRERELMWLAYVEGASHREIAAITGLKEASVRPLLFRARRKLAGLLRARGFGENGRVGR